MAAKSLLSRSKEGRVRLKSSIFKNARRVPPLTLLKIIVTAAIFSPVMILSLIHSYWNLGRWRKKKPCVGMIKRHVLAFHDILPETLKVTSLSGGVSNANQIWELETKDGKTRKYFVKIFVSAGSFWARHISLVSPYPEVYSGRTHERFAVDMVSRVEFAMHGISVPKLVAYDAVEHVMVTEYLEGENVDEILKRINVKESIEGDDREALSQCGQLLAKIHNLGYALIDTQPVNCIWLKDEKKVYFTDLEFCTREDRRIWDISFFLCFVILRLKGTMRGAAKKAFLESYLSERPVDISQVAGTRRDLREFLPIFRTILDIRQYTPEELIEELLSFE